MARHPKDLNQYPAEFPQIIRGCALQGKVYQLHLLGAKEPRQGKRLSGLWFNYLGNLRRRAMDIADRKRDPTADEAALIELASLSHRVMCYLEGGDRNGIGATLIKWQNRERSWQSQMLQDLQVLGEETTPDTTHSSPSSPGSPDSDSELQRLLRIQHEVDKGRAK